jgi:hypothetical protein
MSIAAPASSSAPIQAYGQDTPQKLFRARSRDWAAQAALRHKNRPSLGPMPAA